MDIWAASSVSTINDYYKIIGYVCWGPCENVYLGMDLQVHLICDVQIY